MKTRMRLARTAAIAALTAAASLAISQTVPQPAPTSASASASASASDSGTWTQAGPFGWDGMVNATATINNQTGYPLNLDTGDLSTYQTWFTAPLTIPAGQSGQVEVNVGAYNLAGDEWSAPGDDYANIVYDENGVPDDFHLQGSEQTGCGSSPASLYETLNGVDWSDNSTALPGSHMESQISGGCASALANSSITIGGGSPFEVSNDTYSIGGGPSESFDPSDFGPGLTVVDNQNSNIIWAGFGSLTNKSIPVGSNSYADGVEKLLITQTGDGSLNSTVTLTGALTQDGNAVATLQLSGTIDGWDNGVPIMAFSGTVSILQSFVRTPFR